MTDRIFNTPFEMSLHVVLLLAVIHEKATLDRIAEYDFITVRAGEFGLDDRSLNGDSIFAFGELAAKRELVREALKGLVMDGVVDVTDGNEGITYSLTDSGRGLDEGLVSEYASRYRTVMKKVNRRYRNKSDVELAGIINRQSTKISKR
jgi:hypothetical protein